MSQVIGAEEMPVYEEEVVVTATRVSENASETPGQTEVITKVKIEDSGQKTVGQLLASEGMAVTSYGGESSIATIRIDGSTAEQTLVLVNGLPANQGCLGQVDLSFFPTAGIERIEISHGPLSALYGANALGGVVNIITDLTGEPKNNISFSDGGYEIREDNQFLGITIQQNHWGISVGANTSDGYRDNSENEGRYFTGQYDLIQTDEDYLRLYWQFLKRKGQDPGSLSAPLVATTLIEESKAINLNGKQNIWGGIWEYKIFSQDMDYIYDCNDYFSYDFHLASNYGLDLAGLYYLGQHELLTGGVFLLNKNFESTISGEHAQKKGGIFLQDSWSLSDNFKLVSGARWTPGPIFHRPLTQGLV